MKVSGVEQAFRNFLSREMKELWMMTWHEDREITPGVPDLHYVMIDPEGVQSYRVGWLELKAVNRRVSKTNNICVEPSQHQYIRRWDKHMPIHFAVRIIDYVYIIPGKWHRELAMAATEVDVAILADIRIRVDDISVELPIFLKKVTLI